MEATLKKDISLPVTRNIISGRDIVIIGLQPWYYEIGSNCKNIAVEFSRHNRVLYVNIPINRKTYLSKTTNPGIERHRAFIKEKKNEIRQINDQMWEFYPVSLVESINKIPFTSLFSVFNYFNNKRFAKNILDAMQKMHFKDIILFNDNDIYNGYFLKELLKPSLYIYYCRDFLQGYDYWKKHCTVLEPKLISKADLVATNSMYYAEYCKKINPNSHYIGQGCNLELFDGTKDLEKIDDLTSIKHPIVGYVGAIDSARLDERIILHIAEQRKDISIVLVGPEDELFSKSQLHSFSNVYFLGRKNLAQLPDYINHFDVCINPQLNNIITEGNYPLKIDEYLAMGKPVVATKTLTMKLFEDYVLLADKPEDYPALIDRALSSTPLSEKKRRMDFAHTHSWENSMKELYLNIIQTELSHESIKQVR